MKNRKFIFMLMLYINGLFISQIGFAEPVARDKSFFNINRAKIDFYNQNEKNQHGYIYIKGSFLNAPCELISNEISLKELYIKDIDVVIGGCNIYSDFKNSSNSKPMFTSVLSFTNKINNNVENIDIRMNRLKHYKDNVILNYLFSDEIKRNILDRKLNILTLKLQYN